MRSVLVAMTCVVFAGCTFGAKTCSDNSECGGAECVSGFCLALDGGSGGGGGSVTGGGGGTTGGGGGGVTGGGGGGGTLSCSQGTIDSCAEWQECQPTLTGGTCVDAQYELTWLSPTAGTRVPLSALGRVSVSKLDGGLGRPAGVPVRSIEAGTSVTFMPMSANFEGGLASLLGSTDQTYNLVVGWEDGGRTIPVALIRDTTGPVLTVTPVGRPDAGDPDPAEPSAWKKDEKALVRVTVDDPTVSVTGTNFSVPWSGAVTSALPALCGCSGTGCFCFEVDLGATTINGIRADQTLNVGPVSDSVGNVSNTAPGTIRVTRFKWQRTLGSSTTATPLPVAVSQSGLVVAGTVEAGTNRLLAFSQSGAAQWAAIDAGTVTSGPVLSATEAWVGSVAALAQLQPMSLSTGTMGSPECNFANTSSYDGELALGTVNLLAGVGDRPLGVRAGQLRVADETCNAFALSTFTGPPRIVLQGAAPLNVFVAGGAATLWKAQLDTGQSWSAQGTATTTVAPARALALDGTYLVGGGGVANGGVFSLPAVGVLSGTTTNFHAPAGAAAAGPASLGSTYALYGDAAGRLVKIGFASGVFGATDTAVTVASGSSTQETSPVIGANGHVYSVAANGSLIVSAVGTLSEDWRADTFFPISGSKIGQPALDVLRTSTGAKDCRGLGVLYVATASAGVGSLTALVVDSAGLVPRHRGSDLFKRPA